MFHIVDHHTFVHVVSDIDAAEASYEAVTGSVRLFRKPHPGGHGEAARHFVAGVTVEPLFSPDPGSNIHRVRARYGERLYSSAWLVDDLDACLERFRKLGVRVYGSSGHQLTGGSGGNAFFTHPRDTFGTLEFASAARHLPPNDGRDSVHWSKDALVQRFSHLICNVPSVDAAARLYAQALEAVSVEVGFTRKGWRSLMIRLQSGHLVEFREPCAGNGPAVAELSSRGIGPAGLAFIARDLQALAKQLSREDHHHHLVEDGVQCCLVARMHGVQLEFLSSPAGVA